MLAGTTCSHCCADTHVADLGKRSSSICSSSNSSVCLSQLLLAVIQPLVESGHPIAHQKRSSNRSLKAVIQPLIQSWHPTAS